MASFNYILSFSSESMSPSLSQLHAFITQNRDVEAWYYAFKGTYILKSNKAIVDFNAPFQQIFGEASYILTYAQLSTGALPVGIWEWFNNKSQPLLGGS